LSVPNISGQNLFIAREIGSSDIINLNLCERYYIYATGAVTSYQFLATNTVNVKQIIINDAGAVTSLDRFALDNTGLIDLQIDDTSNVSDWSSFCNGCVSLKSVSDLDLTSATDIGSWFEDCQALTSLVANNSSGILTTVTNAFLGTNLLTEPPLLNYSGASNMTNIFRDGGNIAIDSSYDFSGITNLNSFLFSNDFIQFFRNDTTSSVTNFSSAFRSCPSLRIAHLDCTAASVTSNMFLDSSGIQCLRLDNLSVTTSAANLNLDGDAIDSLAGTVKDMTGLSSPTITLTGNPGTATYNPALWAAKNWTVVI